MASPWDSNWRPKTPAEQDEADRTVRPHHGLNGSTLLPAQVNSISFNNNVLIDWSRQGYTSARHVDFQEGSLPQDFVEHEELGKSNSVVRKVEVLGTFLAMKTYAAETEKRRTEVLAEISILRRLRHHHIIEYVGSMSRMDSGIPRNPKLSALFWPVAPCGLDRFLQEINTLGQAICDGKLKGSVLANSIHDPELGSAASILRRIVFPGSERDKRTLRVDKILRAAIRRLFASFGCLAEALFYVHRQLVSHKDIKPPNILIYPNEAIYQSTESNPDGERVRDGLRLTDFDGAKDLSQASITMAEDGWCTYKYASPETHTNNRSSRSGDIFSMGCVYLEMFALATIYPYLTDKPSWGAVQYFSQGTLRLETGSTYLALHARNGTLAPLVAKIAEYFPSQTTKQREGAYRLQTIIQSMLHFDPKSRPSADMVVLRLSAADVLRETTLAGKEQAQGNYPLFGRCCDRFGLGVAESHQLLPSGEGPSKPHDHDGATTPRAVTPSAARGQDLLTPPPHTPLRYNGTEDDDDDHHQHESPAWEDADESPPAYTVPPVAWGEYTIQWNRHDQRIDPPIVEYNRAAFDRVKKLELCRYRYLRGVCQNVDTCDWKHNYDLSQSDLDILRALNRLHMCNFGTKCTSSTCFSGHNCSNMRPGTLPEDRTKTSSCYYGGPRAEGTGNCHFSKEMHDMDIRVAYRTER
jgi:serine/threonine protein kinase